MRGLRSPGVSRRATRLECADSALRACSDELRDAPTHGLVEMVETRRLDLIGDGELYAETLGLLRARAARESRSVAAEAGRIIERAPGADTAPGGESDVLDTPAAAPKRGAG